MSSLQSITLLEMYNLYSSYKFVFFFFKLSETPKAKNKHSSCYKWLNSTYNQQAFKHKPYKWTYL